ncbi:EDD domain protein, DegV family [Pilibacter termitis]|jgi:DegV family protein with EDD domain|uniref:EDD domain protein, DegV family n=1 Tax=Pilibacter termitis TaxID=263852 RepID=A0A1T4N155_9ENTE|nr:DegV family protein [Pilibacter termitis]SJZ73100.1 EDD domain protein, DegV family [Pilibacter termitis]
MKIAIVTDSTAVLSEETKNQGNLFVLPIPVVLDGEAYSEGVEINEAEFFERIKTSSSFPTTSQPSLGEVIELYQEIQAKGFEKIIAIHLSSGISGFLRNVATISDVVENLDIHLFDSKITSTPMGHMVDVAVKMSQENKTVEEILNKLERMRKHTKAYMIVDDLDYLVRGGRLHNGVAIIGGLLKIKPILTFEDGQIELSEKVRTSTKAFSRIEELVEEKHEEFGSQVYIDIIHSNNLTRAKEIRENLLEKLPNQEIGIATFGPVIGTHLGDKAIGFGIVTQK